MTVATMKWLSLAFLCAACDEGVTGLLVRFHSGRSIPDEADTLEVTVVGADDGEVVETQSYELAPIGAFPATIGMTRGGQTPARVRIEGVLYLDEAAVAAGAAVTEFVDGANRQVDVPLIE